MKWRGFSFVKPLVLLKRVSQAIAFPAARARMTLGMLQTCENSFVQGPRTKQTIEDHMKHAADLRNAPMARPFRGMCSPSLASDSQHCRLAGGQPSVKAVGVYGLSLVAAPDSMGNSRHIVS